MMAEIDNMITIAVGSHLIQAVILVAQPIIAFGILINAIETTEGSSAAVVSQHRASAIVVNEEQGGFLVADEQ